MFIPLKEGKSRDSSREVVHVIQHVVSSPVYKFDYGMFQYGKLQRLTVEVDNSLIQPSLCFNPMILTYDLLKRF